MENPRHRILPPYMRRVNDWRHRGLKIAVVAAILVFSIVMGFWVAIFSTLVVPMFLAVIGLLLVAALWMADDLEPGLERPATSLILAFLLLSACWPSYLAVELPGLPWITPTRLVFALMALLMLLQLSQSRIVRTRLAGTIGGLKQAFVAYAIFIGCSLGTVVLSGDPSTALTFVIQQLILWNVPFLAALWLFHDGPTVERAVRLLAIGALVMFAFTMLEYRNGVPIWMPYIPSFLKIDGSLLNAIMQPQVRLDGGYRARGPFAVHLYYSQFLLMVLPFMIHWVLDAQSSVRRGWAGALLLGMLVVIWMNNTRTATTGQLVVIAGSLGIYALRHYLHTRNKLDMTAPALALGIPMAAAVGAMLIAISPRLQTMTIGGTQNAGSDAVRDGQWEKAWSAVASNPLGYGANESGPLAGRLLRGIWIVDSQWINFIVDFGILGAGAWAAFLGLIAGTGVLIYLKRVDRQADLCGPAAIAIGSFLMTMYTISFVGNFPIVMVMAGIVCATHYRLAEAGALGRLMDVLKRKGLGGAAQAEPAGGPDRPIRPSPAALGSRPSPVGRLGRGEA